MGGSLRVRASVESLVFKLVDVAKLPVREDLGATKEPTDRFAVPASPACLCC